MAHRRRGGSGRRIEEDRDIRPIRVLLRKLMHYLRPFIPIMIATTIISILYAATQLVNPLILANGIDSINTDKIIELDGQYYVPMGEVLWSVQSLMLFFGGTFLFVGVLGFILQSFTRRMYAKVQAGMIHDIRMDVYHQLINSSMSYLKKEQSGNITARITGDTEQIGMGIQTVVNVAIQFILLIATLVILVVSVGWQILLITLGTIPAAILLSLVFSQIGRRLISKIRKAFGEVSGKMAESIAGVAVSKSFNQEDKQSEQLKELNEKYYNYFKRFGLMINIAFPIIGMLASIASGFILWIGGVITLSAGEIFLGITLANQFLQPLIILSFSFPQLQSALGALDRVMDVLEATPALEDKEDAETIEKQDRSVTFEHVWFAYEEDNYVIKDVDFYIPDGQFVALVGHTGAGKTTIAGMLLPRFYDIQKGSIKIGGQDIRELTQTSLRNTIGLIPQEPYLFNATITENIAYGKPDATEEEIKKLCKMLGADRFIDALPEGYDTVVKEGGKQLSAGQRQMITIARTMLADPEILVLDEATSRLDTYTESLVQAAQEKLFENRTTFVIAHRLSTIHMAEKILVFDHGELIEEGSHKQLMELDGVYADLYNTYYAFQGLEEIDLEKFVDEEEEVELAPLALLEQGKLTEEKLNKLRAEGKITPEIEAKIQQMKKKRGKATGK
ncbi:MAG: ABC transporter ATP-binding protein [Asgard group archaeon]|nr:ABC transporter ATP-binding protein [Asgard group archaeon]